MIGSIRRECLDHVVVFNAMSLRRILASYFAYYHRSRTHLSLGKDSPEPRLIEPTEMGPVVALPQVGGLHHRYQRQRRLKARSYDRATFAPPFEICLPNWAEVGVRSVAIQSSDRAPTHPSESLEPICLRGKQQSPSSHTAFSLGTMATWRPKIGSRPIGLPICRTEQRDRRCWWSDTGRRSPTKSSCLQTDPAPSHQSSY